MQLRKRRSLFLFWCFGRFLEDGPALVRRGIMEQQPSAHEEIITTLAKAPAAPQRGETRDAGPQI